MTSLPTEEVGHQMKCPYMLRNEEDGHLDIKSSRNFRTFRRFRSFSRKKPLIRILQPLFQKFTSVRELDDKPDICSMGKSGLKLI